MPKKTKKLKIADLSRKIKFNASSRLTLWNLFLVAVIILLGLIFVWNPLWFSTQATIIIWLLLGLILVDKFFWRSGE